MEQRIGPNIQPLQGAAVDPAFVPGITGPRPAAPKDAEPAETTEEAVSQETASEKRSVSKAPASKTPASKDEAPEEEPEKSSAQKPSGGKPAAGDSSDDEPSDDESSDDEPSDKSDESPDGGGPVFEAADRRARIVADHSGVRLTLDDQEAEFRWDEIGAVETESPRFGKRFTITVHTPDRRWYPLEIEATSRSSFKEWETSLDEVLDTYFEDDEAAEPAEESAP
ncbi:hypothetical protein OHS59_17160 [Streptomyces sp. NBC_00414]|uniref:hypothetical protein n=1 Tax=Streptomyces sp. NBC_00414 TaxID=2975739 RepID=UPI002E251C4C